MSVARHASYNIVGAIIPVAVALVTTPLYLNVIGLERYGVLSLAWVLAGYFSFFDFGLGRALSQRIAFLAGSTSEERSRTFWSGLMLSAAFSVAAVIVFLPIASTVLGTTQMNPPIRAEMFAAMPLLLLALPIGIFQSLLTGSLEGRRAFGPITLVGIVGSLLTGILPLASAFVWGPNIWLLIAATLLARTAILVTQAVICRREIPVRRPEILPRTEIGQLLRFGGWTAISATVGPILVYFDRFAIGAILGSAAVAYYVVAYNLISQLQAFPNALVRALFPRLSELGAERSLVPTLDAIAIVAAMATTTVVFGVLLVDPFFRLWIGADIARRSSPIAIIMFMGFWANVIAFVPFARLHSIGRPDLPAKLHLAELAPYLATLIFAAWQFGLKGAAVVWTMRCASDLAAMLFLSNIAGQHLRKLAAPFALVILASFAGLLNLDWPTRTVALVLLGGSTIANSWTLLPKHVRASIFAFPSRLRRVKRDDDG